MGPIFGGIKLHDLHANLLVILREFSPIIVHDVWIGVIK